MNQRMINMTFAEIVNDGVPSIPEFIKIGGIPPIPIEQTIAESQQFKLDDWARLSEAIVRHFPTLNIDSTVGREFVKSARSIAD